ncbi:MAG: glycoside hydrolase family 15 protein [Elusimicrobia bacterium]|nr:glycoside hydrolase family 15 protein [Elusimicrobiota bacterium]
MNRRPLSALLAAALAAALAPAARAALLTRARLDALFDGRRPLPAAAVGAPAAARVSALSAVESGSLDAWLANERQVALQKMEANISPAGAAPGTVAASPSRANPDYWYNWRRDAALTMRRIVALYESSSDPATKAKYLRMLTDYAAFVRHEQTVPGPGGLGEPKYGMDGKPFTGPWGRPQDDGPAEEAGTLIELARAFLAAGRTDLAAGLWGDASSGIKADLEYVSHHWQETSFDVWEEVKAHHLDTQIAQRDALREGAWLARRLGDDGAAGWYDEQAAAIDEQLGRYWNAAQGYLDSSLDQDGGLQGKDSGLDSAVILAAIHRLPVDGEALTPDESAAFSVVDPRILATAEALKARFRAEYAINGRPGAPGVAIGRYPEDRYFGGNPWVLLTAAFAQLDYMAADEYIADGKIDVTAADAGFWSDLLGRPVAAGTSWRSGDGAFGAAIQALKSDGDAELACVRLHANPDGSLSEQMDRDSGYMTSARDLTWNYAAMLSALSARDKLAADRR